jgi:hypothetical protein
VADDDAGAVPHVQVALVVGAGDGGIVSAGLDEPVRRVGRADADGMKLFSSHSQTVGQNRLVCFQALIFEIGTRDLYCKTLQIYNLQRANRLCNKLVFICYCQ